MTRTAEPKVHITLTIPQARAMVDALDIYMRLGLGQIHMVSEMVADGSIPIKSGSDQQEMYDGLTVRYTDDPAPECVIIEEGAIP